MKTVEKTPQVADEPVPAAAPAEAETPKEENPQFPKAFVTFAGSAAVAAIGLELLTNEYEKMRAQAMVKEEKGMGDIVKQLSIEKAVLGLAKCAGGWYVHEKVSGKMAEGAGIGMFVSGIADFVEVVGWNMTPSVFENVIIPAA